MELTAAGHAHGLGEPLVGRRGQAEVQQQHRTLAGAHHQAGARPALRHLAGERLAEVEGGDDLTGLALDAGDAGAAGAAEGAVLGVWVSRRRRRRTSSRRRRRTRRIHETTLFLQSEQQQQNGGAVRMKTINLQNSPFNVSRLRPSHAFTDSYSVQCTYSAHSLNSVQLP